jgi:hypothetical protein
MTDFSALFAAFHETMESEAIRKEEVSNAVKEISSKSRALGSLLQRFQRCKSMEGLAPLCLCVPFAVCVAENISSISVVVPVLQR